MLCFCLVFRIFVIVEDLSSEFQEIDSNIYNDMIDCEILELFAENVAVSDERYRIDDIYSIRYIYMTSCIMYRK